MLLVRVAWTVSSRLTRSPPGVKVCKWQVMTMQAEINYKRRLLPVSSGSMLQVSLWSHDDQLQLCGASLLTPTLLRKWEHPPPPPTERVFCSHISRSALWPRWGSGDTAHAQGASGSHTLTAKAPPGRVVG